MLAGLPFTVKAIECICCAPRTKWRQDNRRRSAGERGDMALTGDGDMAPGMNISGSR